MLKNDLYFEKALMNAAGTLGFAPDPKGPVELSQLGAFVTNPVSRGARTPARGKRFSPYPGGFVLHSGLPNPGLNAVIQKQAALGARHNAGDRTCAGAGPGLAGQDGRAPGGH